MEDKTLRMTLLFDFFGDLLTEKQREYFDLYYNEDLSLSEIAGNVGITRQGVRDIIVRAEATLLDYEERTGIVARFQQRNADIDRAEESKSRAEKRLAESDPSIDVVRAEMSLRRALTRIEASQK